MQKLLSETSRIVSARVGVSAGTTITHKLTTPAEILRAAIIQCSPDTPGTLPNKTGWKLSNGGRLLIPAAGTYDGADFPGAESAWMPGFVYPVSIGEINQPLQGSPFEIEITIYNSDSIKWWWYFIFTTSPLVDLPLAPITQDAKKDD